jgi:hypothetical protein
MRHSQLWQQIIWREWRHCPDPEYGQQLFELVADEPAGWVVRFMLIGLDGLTGASLGLIIGFVLSSNWEMMRQIIWAGGLVGGIFGYLVGRKLSWQGWLSRLSANTPTSDWPRFIGNALLLGLMGGLIFGPMFWLSLVGLFWGIGSLLPWLNRGSETTASTNPDERRWWFWWRRRPWLSEVEAALGQAPGGPWQTLLLRLAERRAQALPPEVLFPDLWSPDWQERFIACHTLASQGDQALFYLQTVPRQAENTPLQQTLDWLLLNLKRPAPRLAALRQAI